MKKFVPLLLLVLLATACGAAVETPAPQANLDPDVPQITVYRSEA